MTKLSELITSNFNAHSCSIAENFSGEHMAHIAFVVYPDDTARTLDSIIDKLGSSIIIDRLLYKKGAETETIVEQRIKNEIFNNMTGRK